MFKRELRHGQYYRVKLLKNMEPGAWKLQKNESFPMAGVKFTLSSRKTDPIRNKWQLFQVSLPLHCLIRTAAHVSRKYDHSRTCNQDPLPTTNLKKAERLEQDRRRSFRTMAYLGPVNNVEEVGDRFTGPRHRALQRVHLRDVHDRPDVWKRTRCRSRLTFSEVASNPIRSR